MLVLKEVVLVLKEGQSMLVSKESMLGSQRGRCWFSKSQSWFSKSQSWFLKEVDIPGLREPIPRLRGTQKPVLGEAKKRDSPGANAGFSESRTFRDSESQSRGLRGIDTGSQGSDADSPGSRKTGTKKEVTDARVQNTSGTGKY
jgi:hypothetical protein